MTSDLEARARDDASSHASRSERRAPSLVLPALLALGVVVYELTSRPDLGAAIACTKFGWEDLSTARWLRRRDLDRNRGRATFWLFVASGLWKTAVTGVLVMFGVAFLESMFRPPPFANKPVPAPPDAFMGALFVAVVGFFCCTLATGAAFLIALRHRVRLWSDRQIHRERRADRWPPTDSAGRRNRAGAVLFTALFLGLLALLVVVNVILHAMCGWLGFAPGAQNVADTLVNLFCCGLFLILPVAMLVCRDILAQLALARTPADCWGVAADPNHEVAPG